MTKFTGGCQCGAIRFEASGDPLFAGHCSCRDCQMASGTGHSTIAAFPESALKVTGVTTKYTSAGGSGQPVTPQAAIFQRSAQPWDHANPALPKFDTTPPGLPPSH